MATLFRATVMLSVLVGLPAAWIYYGPLPPSAQKVVDRAVEIGKDFLNSHQAHIDSDKVAPRYSEETQKLSFDPEITPTNYIPQKNSLEAPAIEQDSLQAQLEPHLSVLRNLGASEYTLEKWGANDQLVRFRCLISFGVHDDCNRQFEAIAKNSLEAVRQVVGEVTACQFTQGGTTQWR